ncbi:ribonuclease I [Entomohabitans teleogrylli]|uniref:ribonuclease I n=1 Tax=Entomohabitans teleogrylli TaxID=1384589 RepID=UPI00073DA61A|nr:ribonuclease I [Entomohabitans teleogrylli]
MTTTRLSGLLLAAAFSGVAPSALSATLEPQRYGDFDRYVLALSWQTGFCQSMYERQRNQPAECRTQQENADKSTFLTVHGLWPGLPDSISARGVDEKRWMRYGCATRPIPNMAQVAASKKCAAPATGLSADIAARLAGVMPGAGGNSCLERYEYAKHGACFGFDPDAYFGTMIRMNQEVRRSPLGQFLAENYGRTVSRGDINAAIARAWGKESVKAVKLTCHSNPAYLTEIQLSLNAAAINQPLAADSFAPQPHPGNCGKRFRIDAVGY